MVPRPMVFLAASLALLALPCAAAGDAGMRLDLAQVRFPGTPLDSRPGALATLAREVALRTSIPVDPVRVVVPLEGDEIRRHPLLFLPVEGPLEVPPPEALAGLGGWLQRGGTLVIDFSGDPGEVERVLESISRVLDSALPGLRLERVASGSILYRTFYRLQAPAGRIQLFPELYAATLGDRLAVVVSLNDLLGALDRRRDGEWRFRVVPGGEIQRERAVRLGVNLVAYVLCLDYKNEKVHLDYLRSRRSWRLDPEEAE
ncbi:MAG: DUF4159 domain-containing protein [Deltaproteobacteria bacterium]|nr:DUF4159 domain-containing protein [Deltaproteobacteria bacterium]